MFGKQWVTLRNTSPPNGSRLTCAAKRMLNCKQPTSITEPVTTPIPLTRRQVQPLVRPRVSFNTSTDFVLPVIEMTRHLFQPQDLDDFDICYDLGTPHKMPPNPE